LILRIVHPGEVLGLNAAVSGKPYQATAETLDNCQIAFVKREDFLRLLQEHKKASVRAAQQLSSSYQTALGQLRSLGLSHSAPEKLARFLLDWAGQGQDSKHGIRARLTLTQEEIGQIIGTSRETVSRMFSEFRTSQLATMKGSTLIIQDRAALEKLTATYPSAPRPRGRLSGPASSNLQRPDLSGRLFLGPPSTCDFGHQSLCPASLQTIIPRRKVRFDGGSWSRSKPRNGDRPKPIDRGVGRPPRFLRSAEVPLLWNPLTTPIASPPGWGAWVLQSSSPPALRLLSYLSSF